MKGKTLPCLILALLLALNALGVLPSRATNTAEMYFEPITFRGLDIGNSFWTSVMVKDFIDLYVWQVEATWNASVLELIDVKDPWELSDDIFDVLAPGIGRLWLAGAINNTLGIFTCSAYCLAGVTVGVTGTPGIGYKMMKLQFRVKGYGYSLIHYNQPNGHTYWVNSELTKQPCIYTDGSVNAFPTAIPVGGYSFPIEGYTTTKPLTTYLALIGILVVGFTVVKRKMLKKRR
jgi:hypothetical protein